MGKKTIRTRKTEKKDWVTYERAYADKGVVVIVDVDGKKHHLSVRDAAKRAGQINQTLNSSNIPDSHRKRAADFLDKIIPVIREAKFQSEAPADLITKAVTNVLNGKTASGKAIIVDQSYAAKMERLHMRFPKLTINEIEKVCAEKNLKTDEKIGILNTINADRLMQDVARMERQDQKNANE